MVATPQFLRNPLGAGRLWRREVRHAFTDAALVLSLLSGGCTVQRPQPDDDDDDDPCGDEACPDDVAAEADADAEPDLPPPSSPDDIPGSCSGSCCSPHGGLGCRDHTIESCVCGLDPKCCTDGWDATCVMTAEQLCQSCSDGTGPWG